MKFFRRIAGLLGFDKDDGRNHDDKHNADEEPQPRTTPFRVQETGHPRRGFSVPAHVVVDRPHLAPVITLSTSGDGGVQGLRWYAKSLKMDEDGDVADEFLDEVSSESSALAVERHKSEARFKLKYTARPVKVKKQILSDGKLQQLVEHRGRLQLV